MPDNHSDIEDHDNLSSDGEVRSVGSSPSGGLNFKSNLMMTSTDRSSPPSSALSLQGSSPTFEAGQLNGVSPNSASITSVQAALAALKAGQMSLNQVCYIFFTFMMLKKC